MHEVPPSQGDPLETTEGAAEEDGEALASAPAPAPAAAPASLDPQAVDGPTLVCLFVSPTSVLHYAADEVLAAPALSAFEFLYPEAWRQRGRSARCVGGIGREGEFYTFSLVGPICQG